MTQEINLLGSQLRRQRVSLNSSRVLGPLLLVAVAIGVGAGLYLKHQARDLRERHARSEAAINEAQDRQRKLAQEVAQLKKDPALASELQRLEKRLVAVHLDLKALSDGALGETRGFSEFMRALSRQGIDGVWLTGFSVGSAGSDIAISGRALRAELVPAYLKRLGEDPYFAGRSFAALDVGQPQTAARADASGTASLAFSLMSRRAAAAGAEQPHAGAPR